MALDEWTDFINNATLTYQYTKREDMKPLLPVMSFLKFVGGNFSEAFFSCYKTSEEIMDYYGDLGISFTEDRGNKYNPDFYHSQYPEEWPWKDIPNSMQPGEFKFWKTVYYYIIKQFFNAI